jgi:phosphohistidine phosphatase
MNLYLVRHAEPRDESENQKRPLSEKGRQDIRKVAAFVADQLNIRVSSIFHSGKLRAAQTAKVLMEHLNPAGGLIKTNDLNPLDDPAVWVKKLDKIKKDTMLVGHLPFLGKLAALLVCNDADREIVRFQTSEVVCLKKLESGEWTINWVINPEDVRL